MSSSHEGSDYDIEGDEEYQKFEEIKRKQRTHDLRLTADYCRHWKPHTGIREILQNFFDGICSAFDVALDQVIFVHKEQGGPDSKRWLVTWTASKKKDANVVMGTIVWNRKTCTLQNACVELTNSVLLTGTSSKRGKRYIGGHGEGMKVGILRLLMTGHSVKYSTSGELWNFFMRKARGSNVETLHYRCLDSKAQTYIDDTVVRITNIKNPGDPTVSRKDLDFIVENFLALAKPTVLRAVEASRCREGFLLTSTERMDLKRGRLYVKGLFICKDSTLRVSVNFATTEVNRDRELIANDSEFIRLIARIWTATLVAERHAEQRPLSLQFLGLVQAKSNAYSRETLSLQEMDTTAAQCLYNLILDQESGAFPCLRGAEDDKKSILTLEKVPYECEYLLLDLLMKLPQVKKVSEAQREMFLSHSSTAEESVKAQPLALMLDSFVKRVTKGVITIRYNKASQSHLQALLCGRFLVVCERVINLPNEAFETRADMALKAITVAEAELSKGKEISEVTRIAFEAKKFIVSSEFKAVLFPKVIAVEDRRGDDFTIEKESTVSQSLQIEPLAKQISEEDEPVQVNQDRITPKPTHVPTNGSNGAVISSKRKRAQVCLAREGRKKVKRSSSAVPTRGSTDLVGASHVRAQEPLPCGNIAVGMAVERESQEEVDRGLDASKNFKNTACAANSDLLLPLHLSCEEGNNSPLTNAELPHQNRTDALHGQHVPASKSVPTCESADKQVAACCNGTPGGNGAEREAVQFGKKRTDNSTMRSPPVPSPEHRFRVRLDEWDIDVSHSFVTTDSSPMAFEQSFQKTSNPSNCTITTRANLSALMPVVCSPPGQRFHKAGNLMVKVSAHREPRTDNH